MTRTAPRLGILLTAFCLTLSLLALRDQLDAPQRVDLDAVPPPMLVIAGS